MREGAGWGRRELPVRSEVVHESARTRVTRLFLPGRTVVRKEPLGPDAQRRLRHEMAMLERLRGVDGVAQLVEAPRYPGSIVLADVGGTDLAGLGEPLPVDELIDLAVLLARAVAGAHRRGVMHGDITPANIVLSPAGAPFLVDFALATSVAEIRPEFTRPPQPDGGLRRPPPGHLPSEGSETDAADVLRSRVGTAERTPRVRPGARSFVGARVPGRGQPGASSTSPRLAPR